MSGPDNNFSPPGTRSAIARRQEVALSDQPPHVFEAPQEIAENGNVEPADGRRGDDEDDQEGDGARGSGGAALEADQNGDDDGKNDDGVVDHGPYSQPIKYNSKFEEARIALLRAEVDIQSQTTTDRDKITRELAVKNHLLAVRSTKFPNGILIGEARISKVLREELEGKAKRDVGDQFDSSGDHLQHTTTEIDRLLEEFKAQTEEKQKFDSMSEEKKNEAKERQESLKQKADEARGQALMNMRSPPSCPRDKASRRPSSAPVGGERGPNGDSSAEELYAYKDGEEFAPKGKERGPGEPPQLKGAMGALVEVLKNDSVNTHKEKMDEIKRKRAVDDKEADAQIEKDKRQKQESDAVTAKLGAEAALIAAQAAKIDMETEVMRDTGTESASAENELKRAQAEKTRAEADVARKNAENAGLQLQMQLNMMNRSMPMPLQPQLEPRPANEKG